MRVIIINGCAGVGKTTVASLLIERCPPRSAWIDSDRVCAVQPFELTDRFFLTASSNVISLIRNFRDIYDSPVVVISGVLSPRGIWEHLSPAISELDLPVAHFVLRCSETVRISRIHQDFSGQEKTFRIVNGNVLDELLAIPDTMKIDTQELSPADIVDHIARGCNFSTNF